MRSGTKLTIFAVVSLTLVASASVFGFYRSNNARSGGINTVDVASEDALSGKAPVAEHYASRGEAFEMRFDDALLVCESGSLIRGTNLSVSGIDRDLPPLGAGMVNVTSGHSGYRFLPHGEHFRKAAGIQMGYDEAKLPKGFSHKDIYTYYYDESMKVWKRLQRDSVSDGTVYSRTTHFTDMINAVVSHPEMPEGQTFTPTGLKELKAASPSAGVAMAEVSAGNSQGELTARYPIELPQGRGGMQPNLAIGYSSGGGDGLLGVGWDMHTSAISVDSRWGAPRYDSQYETESYVIDGDELLPSPRYLSQWEQRNTSGTKTFWRRTESSYDKIERYGDSPTNYYWIVTDKSGTKYYYGTYAGYKAVDTVLPKDGNRNTSRWPLCRVVDADGNYMSYHYKKRSQYNSDGIYLGEQLWLESIEYTGNSRTDEKGQYYVFFGSTNNPCKQNLRSNSSRKTADRLATHCDIFVNIIKTDRQTGARLPNAKFNIYEYSTTNSYEYITDDNGEISTWFYAPIGQAYTITELNAPEGYEADDVYCYFYAKDSTCQILIKEMRGIDSVKYVSQNEITLYVSNINKQGQGGGTTPTPNADSIENIYIWGKTVPDFYLGMDFCDCDREYPKTDRNEARSGHLQSQRDKLRRVLVYYGDEMVRSYSFCYGEDIHGMAQLRKIRQWGRDYSDGSRDHDIEYYREIDADSLLGTATTTMTTADYGLGGLLNGVAGKLRKPIERSLSGVLGTRTVIGGNASLSFGGDAGVYAGVGTNPSSKINSVSYSLGADYGLGFGSSTLCDVDGDGLPDRLLVINGGLHWQRQQNGAFLTPSPISGAGNYLRDSRVSVSHGPVLNVAGISGGVSWSTTTTTTGTYLSDMDGDGLPDIVDDSRISRIGGRYNAPSMTMPGGCGTPTVTPDATPKYPCVEPLGLDEIPDAESSIDEEVPHYDIIKIWESEDIPGTTIQSIDAKAWLGGLVRNAEERPDTVVLSVEYYGTTEIPNIGGRLMHVLIASDTLKGTDTLWRGNLLDPANGYLSREYIDSILNRCEGEESPAFGEGTLFFRARSKGGRDVSREIHWNPQVHVMQPYRYPTHGQRSEVAGFAMGGGTFTAPGGGQAVLRVPTAAADFASAVRLRIRYNNTFIRTLTPGGSPVWDTVLNLAADDSLFFYAEGDTSTIWKNNQWHPYLYYKTLTVGNESFTTLYFDTLAGGVVDTIKTLEYHIAPNYRCYRAGSPKYHLSTASLPFGHGFGGWHAVQYRHDDSLKINLTKLFSISNIPSSATDLNTYYGNLTDSNYMKQISDTTTSGAVGGVLSLFGCMPLTGNGERRRMEGIYPNAYVSGPAISLGVMTDTLLPNVAGNTIPCGQSSGGGDRAYRTSGGSTGSRATAAGGGKLGKISKSKNFSYTVALYSAGNGRTWMERDVTDLNGDGRPDIIDGGGVYYTKPYHILSYESAAYHPFGGGHPYSGTGNSRSVVLPGQFLNTSKQTTSSGRGRDFVLSPGAGKASDITYRTLADLNGDGLPDIVCSDGTVHLGTGYGYLPQQQWPGLETVSASLSLSASASGTFSIWSNAISGGVGVTTARNTQPVFLQDMDGDGLPDLVRRDTLNGEIKYRRNTGSGFATGWTAWRTPDILANLAEYGTSTSASTNIQGTGGWTFWGIKAGGSAGANAALSLSNEKLQISDFDGDGVADLLKSESGTEIAVRYSRMGRTGLLKSIANPLGGTTYADYELTAPTVYHQRRWVVKELKIYDGLPGDGRDTLRTTYSYSHGYYDRDEKAFLGFAKVSETQWNGDTVHSTTDKYFSNSDIHTKGIPVASILRDSRGRLFVQTTNTLQKEVIDATQGTDRVFPHITRSQTCYYEGLSTAGIVKWQETDYDYANGNVLKQRSGSTDQPMVEVEIDYHPQYNGNNIVNRVQRVEIQGMRLRNTTIDTLGHYTAIGDYDGQNTLVTRYEFDVYGNITAVRTPNTAVHYTYEGDVHTYPKMVTDTFGASSQMQDYDLRYGVPLTVIDRAGNSMEYTLDSWGRPLTIRGPKEIADGAPFTIRYTYRGKETARNVSSATTENYDPQHPANPIKTHTYCDGLGRMVQTRVEAEVQGVEKLVVSGHTVFDGLGRAVATYHPTEAHRDSTRFAFAVDAITPSTATYDVLNRPLVQTAPDGSTTRTAYGFNGNHLQMTLFETTLTDAKGNTSKTLKDAEGRQWATKVAGQPWLYCNYNPVGDLMQVYSSNGDWSRAYEYDWLGRRTSYNEDNLATLYTYDGLNPATETHKWQENGQPKQKTITSRYIAHRLDSVIYSDSTLPTVYSYDYAGRVASVLDESGRMDYTYGNMGEVKSETRTYALPFLATDLALTTQYEYDSWGRTTSITYPDGETVSYDYDRGGQLFRMYNVQLTMYNYLDSVLYDKFGAVTSRKYGNGLKMQYAYHPQNRRLTDITTLSGNSQLSHTAYTYDLVGNVTQAVSSYPWLAGQTFTETFAYDSTNQLVSAANPQTYALSVTYGDWGKIQQYDLSQTDLASNTTTSQTRYYSYGSLNEGQTTFAPNSISYADGTNVNEQYGIGGSLQRRETNIPGNQPNEELYRFGADGNLRLYSYDRLFYSLYGYDAGTTRTYKYSFDLNPNWVNGRLESVNFNPHNAMFYPNSYLNFNNDGYYTKHYYNGMERIASRLGDQNLPIATHAPELQDRKDWQDSLIRKNVTEITGYDFLPVGEEQNPDDPKPIFELPQVGLNNLIPNTSAIYYYHPNHLGSTCYVTDENASVVQGFLYAPFGEITNEYDNSFGNNVLPKYSFNAKELDEETGFYYYEARYYAPPVFVSRDRLFEKYPFMSPYGYCMNNPIKYIDPSGDSVIIVIWASHKGRIGHAGIAISNYCEETDANGQTRMVPDGTYTYRDLWPGEDVGKNNFSVDVPAQYEENDRVTLDQLLNEDVSGGEDNRPCDGLIQFPTGYDLDTRIQQGLNDFKKSNPLYNGLKVNCSDYIEAALETMVGRQLPVDEKLSSEISATTPNQVYKTASTLKNGTILKDPGKKVKKGFIRAVSRGPIKQKIAERLLDRL